MRDFSKKTSSFLLVCLLLCAQNVFSQLTIRAKPNEINPKVICVTNDYIDLENFKNAAASKITPYTTVFVFLIGIYLERV